jgi:hypothetical protein
MSNKNLGRGVRGLSTQRRGQLGVNVVERVVLNEWKARWQPIDAQNDDGVDGLIFLESGGRATGQIVFAQVKCHDSPRRADGAIRVNVGTKKLKANIERWRRVVGVAILIHVDPRTLIARWVDLHDAERTGSEVIVPVENFLDAGARRTVAALTGLIHRDVLLKRVDTVSDDHIYIQNGEKISFSALKFYGELKKRQLRLGNNGPLVRFTKDGWQHITRPGRRILTRLQSQMLLGTVPKILGATNLDDLRPFRQADPGGDGEFTSLSALVTFPYRQSAVVKIVFRPTSTDQDAEVLDFHTIYEERRRRDALGRRR